MSVQMLLCNSFKPFHHAEHNSHRDYAYYCKHSPALPDWPCVVHERADPEEEVSECSGTKPKTLAKTEEMLRSNLGNE